MELVASWKYPNGLSHLTGLSLYPSGKAIHTHISVYSVITKNVLKYRYTLYVFATIAERCEVLIPRYWEVTRGELPIIPNTEIIFGSDHGRTTTTYSPIHRISN